MAKTKQSRSSKPFQATRSHHMSEAAEDYTELVAELIDSEGEARIGRIAERLGISHVTALRTVRRLARDGYLVAEARSSITLTPRGRRVARVARERHRILIAFLLRLGVPPEIAETDAEGMEHHISAVTLRMIRAFIDSE